MVEIKTPYLPPFGGRLAYKKIPKEGDPGII
jgi:hypothetical protein